MFKYSFDSQVAVQMDVLTLKRLMFLDQVNGPGLSLWSNILCSLHRSAVLLNSVISGERLPVRGHFAPCYRTEQYLLLPFKRWKTFYAQTFLVCFWSLLHGCVIKGSCGWSVFLKLNEVTHESVTARGQCWFQGFVILQTLLWTLHFTHFTTLTSVLKPVKDSEDS